MESSEIRTIFIQNYGSISGMARSIGWSRSKLNRFMKHPEKARIVETKVIADALIRKLMVDADIFLQQ